MDIYFVIQFDDKEASVFVDHVFDNFKKADAKAKELREQYPQSNFDVGIIDGGTIRKLLRK